jgi:hypothetical protein
MAPERDELQRLEPAQREHLVHRALISLVEVGEHGEQELVLGLEVVEHAGIGDAGPFGDRCDARAPEAVGAEQGDGCIDDRSTPGHAARPRDDRRGGVDVHRHET